MNSKQLLNEKLNIINWITQIQDYSIVEKIKFLMNSEEESSLSQQQQKAIDIALDSIQTNGTISHSAVMEDSKKKYPHLFRK